MQLLYEDKQNFKEHVSVYSGAAQTAGCVKPASLWLSRKWYIFSEHVSYGWLNQKGTHRLE